MLCWIREPVDIRSAVTQNDITLYHLDCPLLSFSPLLFLFFFNPPTLFSLIASLPLFFSGCLSFRLSLRFSAALPVGMVPGNADISW